MEKEDEDMTHPKAHKHDNLELNSASCRDIIKRINQR